MLRSGVRDPGGGSAIYQDGEPREAGQGAGDRSSVLAMSSVRRLLDLPEGHGGGTEHPSLGFGERPRPEHQF